ncbi:hypothetical protein ACSSS7_002212 [Eimeria intestinalis]
MAGRRFCETSIPEKSINPPLVGSDVELRKSAPYFSLNKANDFGRDNLSVDKPDVTCQEEDYRKIQEAPSVKVCADSDSSIFLPGSTLASYQDLTKCRRHVHLRAGAPGHDLGRRVVKKFLTNRMVLNNDGMFVLRFASFEAAEAAVNS